MRCFSTSWCSGMDCSMVFFIGVAVGIICGPYVRRVKVWISRGRDLTVSEAIKYLDSHQKINQNLSPTDNAMVVLKMHKSENLSTMFRACVVYAIAVLQSEMIVMSIPVGLHDDGIGFADPDQPNKNKTYDETVRDWLLSNFTQIAPSTTRSRRSFRSVALGVRFAVRLRHPSGSKVSDKSYIFDVIEEELERINNALEGVDEWDWSVWELREVTHGRPLQALGWHLIHKWELIDKLKLDRGTLRNWLVFVEGLYQANPYHNATHAADVLQAVQHILTKGGAAEYLCPVSIFALIITAIMHDAGHDGFSNLYHQHALTDRALAFNDQSVQENCHCMTIFCSMYKERRINILDALAPEKAAEVRRLMILMVLGTDMKTHFSNLHDFKVLVAANGSSTDKWTTSAPKDQLCVSILHAADLSNPCRRFDLAQRWASLVLEEFFHQGDVELRQGLPISPLCSRDSTLMPASQIAFISYIVQPYYQVLADLLPALQPTVMVQLEANLQSWKALERAGSSSDTSSAHDGTGPGAADRSPHSTGSPRSSSDSPGGRNRSPLPWSRLSPRGASPLGRRPESWPKQPPPAGAPLPGVLAGAPAAATDSLFQQDAMPWRRKPAPCRFRKFSAPDLAPLETLIEMEEALIRRGGQAAVGAVPLNRMSNRRSFLL